ncbi:MAG: type II toxin-antitoxin system VapC family toxin [Chitinophagaceae bacterium]|nr:type II toxin-antitoxin system VapC family toxin [Chitinophagaceae bacterium]
MTLADSNILIYAAKPEYPQLKDLLVQDEIAVSDLTKLEVLGYHALTKEAKEYFNAVFSLVTILPITSAVINKATELRQQHNMKSADAIIAATSLLHCTALITRNISDFNHIPGLTINNPIDK